MTTTTPTTTTAPTATQDRVLGIVSLVLGASSVVMGLNPLFGAAGLVLGILSLRREPAARGLAVAGIVTSAITLGGILLGAAAFLAFLPLAIISGAAWGW